MNASSNLKYSHSMLPIDPFDDEPLSLYDQIDRSIGGHATEKLIADFGGRRLYIPIAPAPGDRLTSSIGMHAAIAMARAFGGDRLVIPVNCDHARRRMRILAMRAEQVSISRIARHLRCSERYVYKVLASEHDAQQISGSDAPAAAPRLGRPRRPSIVSTPASPAERFNRGFINGRG